MRTMSKFLFSFCIAGSLVLGLTAPANAQHGGHLTVFNSTAFKKRTDAFRVPFTGFYHPYVYPNVGVVIHNLPFGYYSFVWNTYLYYYCDGVFYQSNADGSYKITAPPIGAEVTSLPLDAEIVTIDGNPYFQYKGIYYESTLGANDKFVYKVVGKDGIMNINSEPDPSLPLVGDVTDQLPEGTHAIKLSGKTYWVTPEEIYLEEFQKDAKISYRVVWVPARKRPASVINVVNRG